MSIHCYSKIIQNELQNIQKKSILSKDSWYRYYSENKKELITQPDKNFMLVIKEQIFSMQKQGVALELGAGSGANAIWLAQQGWNTIALDFAENAMQRLANIASKQKLAIQTITADITHFWEKLENKKLDLVYACYLHISNKQREKMLQEVYHCLEAGGIFFYLGIDEKNSEYFASQKIVCQQLHSKWKVIFQKTKKGKVAINSQEIFLADIVVLLAVKHY